MNTQVVSEEEMRALLPAYEVEGQYLSLIRRKILLRIGVAVVLFTAGLAMMILYPDLQIRSVLNGSSENAMVLLDSIILFRLSILLPFIILYLFSFLKNLYFRSMTVMSLLIICSFLSVDAELYVAALIQDPSVGLFAVLATRLACLYLFALNYMDVRL